MAGTVAWARGTSAVGGAGGGGGGGGGGCITDEVSEISLSHLYLFFFPYLMVTRSICLRTSQPDHSE